VSRLVGSEMCIRDSADTDQLSDSWFKTEILAGLNGAGIEFIDPSTNEGESGIVAVHLMTPSGVVRLD
jgi:hypothetical protein